MRQIIPAMLLSGFLTFQPQLAAAQDDLQKRVDELSKRVEQLEVKQAHRVTEIYQEVGGTVLFLFGAFCALWAQNTNRNPWLWFFLGLIFNVFAVLVLLVKNSNDRRRARGEPAGGTLLLTIVIIIVVSLAIALAISLAFPNFWWPR